MNLFADYVQPLTQWLQANPGAALFITFLVSLLESVAIIGSIIPGSVTMTAIGILAGSGVMRVDLTLLAGIAGAVCGDSLSYALGYFYRDHLKEIWPFSKYPGMMHYGAEFFSKHGGKSVLLGRFIGPLRSIIPVIAGIMRMQQWRFLAANFLSAIGWAFLYILPGVFIGAAGHELSAESATRLFIIILAVMVAGWLASVIIHFIIYRLRLFFKNYLHQYWSHLLDNSFWGNAAKAITPPGEENHYSTAGLSLLTLLMLISLSILLILMRITPWINQLNLALHLLLQSIHTRLLLGFCILSSQFISTLTLTTLLAFSCCWFIYHKNIRLCLYFISLTLTSLLSAELLAWYHFSPRPGGLLVTMPGSSFPATTLLVATALYTFTAFYLRHSYSLSTSAFRTFALIILGLGGFSILYLGDYWLSDVLAACFSGVIIALLHWLHYRKAPDSPHISTRTSLTVIVLMLLITGSTLLSTGIHYKQMNRDHILFHKKFIIPTHAWWDQQTPILPLYRLNRIGRRISFLNLQYEGDLIYIESALEDAGWVSHHETFFTKLLLQMNNNVNEVKFPLLAQLYENKPPALIMTLHDKNTQATLELALWESSYHINYLGNPLWIGSVHSRFKNKAEKNNDPYIKPQAYLTSALSQFQLRNVQIPAEMIKPTLYPAPPYILLIKHNE